MQSHRKPYYRLTLSLAGRYCLGSLFLSCCCHQPGNTIAMISDGFAFAHLVSLWLQDLHNFRASKCVQFCILPSRLLLSLRDNISNLTSSSMSILGVGCCGSLTYYPHICMSVPPTVLPSSVVCIAGLAMLPFLSSLPRIQHQRHLSQWLLAS